MILNSKPLYWESSALTIMPLHFILKKHFTQKQVTCWHIIQSFVFIKTNSLGKSLFMVYKNQLFLKCNLSLLHSFTIH